MVLKPASDSRYVLDDMEETPAQNGVAASEDPHSIYASKVERQPVREAIDQLPVEFREVLILREYEDLSYEDIMLGCPRGTVMSRLGRARSKLRSLLTGKGYTRRTNTALTRQ